METAQSQGGWRGPGTRGSPTLAQQGSAWIPGGLRGARQRQLCPGTLSVGWAGQGRSEFQKEGALIPALVCTFPNPSSGLCWGSTPGLVSSTSSCAELCQSWKWCVKAPRHRTWAREAGVYYYRWTRGRPAVVSVAPTGPTHLWFINSAALHSSFCCARHGSGSGGSAGANLSPCPPGVLILVGLQAGARSISNRSSSHSWSVLRRSSKAGIGVRIDWGSHIQAASRGSEEQVPCRGADPGA